MGTFGVRGVGGRGLGYGIDDEPALDGVVHPELLGGRLGVLDEVGPLVRKLFLVLPLVFDVDLGRPHAVESIT